MNQHPRAKERIEPALSEVMADSLNVMNQTGRTPSELVELVRELRERLSFFIALVGESQGVSGWHLNGDVAKWGDWQDEVDLSSDILEKTGDIT